MMDIEEGYIIIMFTLYLKFLIEGMEKENKKKKTK